MPGDKCLLFIRGTAPFYSKKYNIKKHPNYKHLAESSKDNAFSVETYLDTKLKTKSTDLVHVFSHV